ncbi:MAG: preprotein translocase subunit SecY [Candidatus Marinimicrobia bacterium]|nr:preprotein translocase subunit SecY [Candidatus Neomarinimicrobiota bacterium]MBL7023069.1 preprotein translocase subunit SecY [Candidatus Neomarinimicrobiota bacterium]MBL7109089.1 preprotein translocase subunit SecY [Candidatus Neomarinimicrobiota bacterium]
MIEKIINIFKIPDLRKKLGIVGFIILVYRLGGHVPVPGINKAALAAVMQNFENSLLGLYDMFAGGFFSQASIFALGIMPYISASIIIQLLGAVIPYFQRLQKEGEEGRKKIIQITRYGTVMIAFMQSIGVAVFLSTYPATSVGPVVPNPGLAFYFVTIVTLVTGTVFIMWLGEQISDHGIGNGISIIIMVGILSRAPHVFFNQIIQIKNDMVNPFQSIILLALMFMVIFIVVLFTTALRKIPVQYAKRVVGRKVYGGQATHIPMRILTAGVMPIIFAQALMFIPNTLASFFPEGNAFGEFIMRVFSPTHAVYSIFFGLMIIVFTYFYTAIAFNPVDVADNMKKQGGFIPGVRPGKNTADFIDNILTRVTLPAAVFLAAVAVFPTILVNIVDGVDYSLASFFGGTSLLIIVGVALDTLQQIESHLVMRHYDGFLKTGKLKGRRRF